MYVTAATSVSNGNGGGEGCRLSTNDSHNNDDTEVRFQRPPDWYDTDIQYCMYVVLCRWMCYEIGDFNVKMKKTTPGP